jgi:hypothetical protein
MRRGLSQLPSILLVVKTCPQMLCNKYDGEISYLMMSGGIIDVFAQRRSSFLFAQPRRSSFDGAGLADRIFFTSSRHGKGAGEYPYYAQSARSGQADF